LLLLSAWEFDPLQKSDQADEFQAVLVIWLLFPEITPEPGIDHPAQAG
jgi:hypothetical protein